VHAAEWSDPDVDADFDGVWTILARGLEAGGRRRAARAPARA
jgi:hypothetical protein